MPGERRCLQSQLQLNPKSKKVNGDLHIVESTICKSLTAQCMAMDKLLELQSVVRKPELAGKFEEVFSPLADSMEFGCLSRARTYEVRRDLVLTSLNDNYKHLSTDTKPEKGLLFGENLEESMRAVETANKLSKKLSHKPPQQANFLGQLRGFRGARGRGQYRGHPYRRMESNHQQGYQYHYSQDIPNQTSLPPAHPPHQKIQRG